MEDLKIQKLSRILVAFGDAIDKSSITKEDFMDFVQKILKITQEIKEQEIKIVSQLEDTYKQLLNKIETTYLDKFGSLQNIGKDLKISLNASIQDQNVKIASLRNGKDADEEIIVEKVLSKIEFPELPKEEDKIALQALKEHEKYMEKEMAKLRKLIEEKKVTGIGRSLGGVLNVGVRVETPTGTVNSTNTTFTAFKVPKWIVIDGVFYTENNGYTLSGKTLTTSVPPTGWIRSYY